MRKILLSAIALTLGYTAVAQQNLRTSYFMDTYAYSYRFNPSFIPRNDHLSIGLGNIGLGVESNIPGTSFLQYDNMRDAIITTFDDPDQMIGKLPEDIRLRANAYVDLFSLGFHSKRFFHSIDLGVKADGLIRIPRNVLDLVLVGDAPNVNHFQVRNFGLNAGGDIELAYGLATKITDRITVGGRAKLQYSSPKVRLNFKDFELSMMDNTASVHSNGMLEINLPPAIRFDEKEIDFDIDELVAEDILLHPTALGMTFDLGATVKVTDNLTASFGVSDFGMLRWTNSTRFTINDFIIRFDDDDHYSPGDGFNFDSDGDGILDSYYAGADRQDDEIHLTADNAFGWGFVSGTLTGGLEYAVPGAKGLSAGIVGTARIAGVNSWTEARAIVNYTAPKVLEMALSGAVSSFGPGAGFALSLDLGPINLFGGIDSFIPLFKTDDYRIPTPKINTNAALGLTIVWGRNKVR